MVESMDGFIESITRLLEFIGALAFICLTAAVGAYFAKEKSIAGILFVAGGIGLVVSLPLLAALQHLST